MTENSYNWYMVAFIDIMGQQDAFRGIPCLPRTESEIEKLHVALGRTVGFIKEFREHFKYFYQRYSEVVVPSDIPAEHHDLFRSLRASDIRYQYISDFFVAYVSLKTDSHHCAALTGIYGVMAACAHTILISLLQKHVLRGGIELGCATELGGGYSEVYGPALNKAYVLESKKAKSFRILVGPELVKYLRAISSGAAANIYESYCKHAASKCLGLVFEDLDGLYAVDFLNAETRHTLRKQFSPPYSDLAVSYDELMNIAGRFLVSERESHRYSDQELFARYTMLIEYFRHRLGEDERPANQAL